MSGAHGQATVEWIGLLALAAVIGAALALIAGPPLVDSLRQAVMAALSGSASAAQEPVVPTAADIADVQAALSPPGSAISTDAALLALARRHGSERAEHIAEGILLAQARERSPWIEHARSFRPELRLSDRFEAPDPGTSDRDVEVPTGGADVEWVTVAMQADAVAQRLNHHTDDTEVALDAASIVPVGNVARFLGEAGELAARIGTRWLARSQKTIELAQTGREVVGILQASDGGVPAGLLVGDVIVSWPVHRTAWRDGREDPHPLTDFGHGFGRHELPRDYRHVVYLRQIAGALAVIGEDARY
jgi:hypothetical protein